MLAMQPFARLEIADIIAHPFFKGESASEEELQAEMSRRQQKTSKK